MIGNEANGLSDEVAALADCKILIPMAGQVESLNAAMAATVLMFEAARQRRIKQYHNRIFGKLLIVTKKILKQNNICDILIIIELWKGTNERMKKKHSVIQIDIANRQYVFVLAASYIAVCMIVVASIFIMMSSWFRGYIKKRYTK